MLSYGIAVDRTGGDKGMKSQGKFILWEYRMQSFKQLEIIAFFTDAAQ